MKAILLVATSLVLAVAAAAQEPGRNAIQTIDLGDGLAMLVGRGGNVAVSVGADGVLLVDDKFAPLAPSLRAAVEKLGTGEIRFILNTHWHGDHTGANGVFGGEGAVIIGHSNVRRRMREDHFSPQFGRTTPASPAEALPVITFDDGVTVHMNGRDVELHAVGPAHTDGDAIVVFRGANLVHLGDVYFNGLYPFVDLSSGGSVDGVIRAVEVGLSHCDESTRIIPGHGPLSDKASLERYHAMLVTVRDAVRGLASAGRTVDEVLAARPSAAFDEVWGGGFISPDDFVRTVFASLEAGAAR